MTGSDPKFRRPGPWSVVPNFTLNDRRLRPCSREARFLYMAGWVYANQNRTDGEITTEDLAVLAGSLRLTHPEAQNAAAELVKAELWETGWRITDFLKWCHDAETVERKTKDNRLRFERWQSKQKATEVTEVTEVTDSNRRDTAFTNALDEGLKSDGVSLHLETDELYTPTPEDLKRGKEASQRLLEISEEKLRRDSNSAVSKIA